MHQKFQLIPAFTIPAFPISKKFRLILANPVRIYRQMQAFSVLFWNFYNEPENSSFFLKCVGPQNEGSLNLWF